MSDIHPSNFHIRITRSDLLSYRLSTSQILPVRQEKAFAFFEDPRNLGDITPAWLDFCFLNKNCNTQVYENAEFDYTIQFLGIKMLWRSRIVDYQPPDRFTDVQVKGPYAFWVHEHILKKIPEGTLMRDEVTYKLHLPALILHPLVIRKKLIDIFTYRAVTIAEWAEKL